MTSEEIKATIDRLKAIPCDGTPAVYRTVGAFMDMDINGSYSDIGLRNRLIGLLKQADPYTHMKLPVDADGEPWHVGDITESIFNEMLTVKSISPDSLVCTDRCGCSHTITPPSAYRHPRKPTVSEILDELEGLRGTGDYEAVVTRAAELASQLREMMQDDQ